MAQSIGERIKALRTEQRHTLAELAERAGVSTSYLSQVERDKVTPSLVTLTALAAALDVQLRYFFETTSEAAFVIRAGDKASAAEDLENVFEQRLVPAGRSRLVVSHLWIPPGRRSGSLPAAPCEEFMFVLSGGICIEVGDERHDLGAGDSLHYDAAQPHSWWNDSSEVCSVIWGSAGGPLGL